MEVFIFDWWWRRHQSRRTRRLTYFQILCFALERCTRTHNQTLSGKTKLTWFKISSQYRTLDTIDGEPMEFEWNIFPGFTTLQLCCKVQEFLSKMSVEPEEFTGRIIIMSMFNDISWGSKDNEQECESNAKLMSIRARRFSPGRWSFFGPGSEKKWYSTQESKPQGEWDRVAELMMLKFGESGHPVFRATSPLSRGTLKSKGGGKLSIHFCADEGTIETVFRPIISVHQLSIYGAVPDLREEYKACHVRTGRPVMAGETDPLFVPTSSLMKTPAPSTNDPAQEDLLQKNQEWGERPSQQNRVIKISTDAGFLTTVGVGQYFMTKRHWRILTIYRVSGLSPEHFAKRWKIIGTKRLDSSEHQSWGPYRKSQPGTYKGSIEWKFELNL